MKRRKFFKILSLGSIGIAFTTYLSFPGFRETVKRIIEQNTTTLNLPEAVIDQYLDDAERENLFMNFSPRLQNLLRARSLLEALHISSPLQFKQTQILILMNFLLSTDFFQQNMDEERPVKYVAFYNPYKRPCANPFSHTYYPDLA